MSLPIVSESTSDHPREHLSGAVIQLDQVSVRYRVPQERIGTFKEYAIRRLQGRIDYYEFWALHEVSLSVDKGELFGIVGRNGAGKSTLLKVISRVLYPTSGRVRVKGRVAPLLDLGAGFHPELTGRENIFLNGALLGHSRQEVDERFPAILEFADLGDFIEAPLRTYSSGMAARLGFAVATAWRPDILILDEILAVGDEAFQRKCRQLIHEFGLRDTTVLLVSHSAETVKESCERALWLDHGVIKALGRAGEVADAYHRSTG